MKTSTFQFVIIFFLLPLWAHCQYNMGVGTAYASGALGLNVGNSSMESSTVDQQASTFSTSLRGTVLFQKKPNWAYGFDLSVNSSQNSLSGPQERKATSQRFSSNFIMRRHYPITKSGRLLLYGQSRTGFTARFNRSQDGLQSFGGDRDRKERTFSARSSLDLGVIVRLTPRLAIIKSLGSLAYNYNLSRRFDEDVKTQTTQSHSLTAQAIASNILSFELAYFFRLSKNPTQQ
ncbi:MAG: hypothetical protein AAFV95_15565 [Bacteroidota bacterium]